MKLLVGVSLGVMVIVLAGCGKQAPDRDIQAMENLAKATAATNASGGKLPPLPEAPKPPQKESGVELKTPLEKYVLLPMDDRDRGFVYLYSALGGKFQGGEDEFLRIVSARYNSEKDAFKRKEVEATEKTRAMAEVERYRQMRYIAFEISQWDIAPYDFEKKGFSLTSFGNCMNETWRVGSGVVLKNFNLKGNCLGLLSTVVVQDVALAKNIESLRASSNLKIKAIVYAYAEEALDGQILITPTALRLRMFDRQQLFGEREDQIKPVADLTVQK